MSCDEPHELDDYALICAAGILSPRGLVLGQRSQAQIIPRCLSSTESWAKLCNASKRGKSGCDLSLPLLISGYARNSAFVWMVVAVLSKAGVFICCAAICTCVALCLCATSYLRWRGSFTGRNCEGRLHTFFCWNLVSRMHLLHALDWRANIAYWCDTNKDRGANTCIMTVMIVPYV